MAKQKPTPKTSTPKTTPQKGTKSIQEYGRRSQSDSQGGGGDRGTRKKN
jgi:hypothetical protein